MKCITFVCDDKSAAAFNKLEDSIEEVSVSMGLPYKRQHYFAGQYVQMSPEDFYNFWTLYGSEIKNEAKKQVKKRNPLVVPLYNKRSTKHKDRKKEFKNTHKED